MRNDFDFFIAGIVKLSNAHCESLDEPKAIITVGEKGSGKEILALEAQDELSRQGGSVLVGDEYFKPYTNKYLDNMKKDSPTTARDAEKEAKFLSDRVLNNAISNKNNVVINNSNESEYSIKELSDRLHKSGYSVEIRANATPHEHSIVRDLQQALDLKGNLGIEEHAEHKAVDQTDISQILESAEEHNLADAVKVYDRVGNQVYSNQKLTGEDGWEKPNEASKTFDFEMNKPLSKSEYQYNQVAWQQLVHLKNNVQSSTDEIEKSFKEKENEAISKKELGQLIINTPEKYKGVMQGEIVDQDEKSIVMRINRFTAIRYDKDKINNDTQEHDFEVGQQLFIDHNQGNFAVMDEKQIQNHMGQELEQQGQQAAHEAEQDFSR